jgi:putative transposase
MEDYQRGSHTVWDCKYHLEWTTKCRYQALGGGERKRDR